MGQQRKYYNDDYIKKVVHGIMLVFDQTRSSFEYIQSWVKRNSDITKYDKKIPYIIVQAKSDIMYKGEVDEAIIALFINEYNCLYSLTSALNDKKG